MYLKNYLKLTKTAFYLVFSLEKEFRIFSPKIYKTKYYYKLTDLEILTVNNFAFEIVGLISFKPS